MRELLDRVVSRELDPASAAATVLERAPRRGARVNGALSGPFLAAAGVLCVSGAAKLRSPAGAVRGVAVLGLPGRAGACVLWRPASSRWAWSR